MSDDTPRKPRPFRDRVPAAIVAAALGSALVTGCNDRTPTKPSASGLQPSLSATASPKSGNASAALIGDARGRLAGSIADAQMRAKLQGVLDALSASLDAADLAGTRRQIDAARKLIAAGLRSGDSADLSAIGLALDQIETQLDASTAVQP